MITTDFHRMPAPTLLLLLIACWMRGEIKRPMKGAACGAVGVEEAVIQTARPANESNGFAVRQLPIPGALFWPQERGPP